MRGAQADSTGSMSAIVTLAILGARLAAILPPVRTETRREDFRVPSPRRA
jgi:hypothetical protein